MQRAVAAEAVAPGARASGVGADLRALRKARGLTLTELAVKVAERCAVNAIHRQTWR